MKIREGRHELAEVMVADVLGETLIDGDEVEEVSIPVKRECHEGGGLVRDGDVFLKLDWSDDVRVV